MNYKVVAFQVTPILLIVDEAGVVHGETLGPDFKCYPGKMFHLEKTIQDIESVQIKESKDDK